MWDVTEMIKSETISFNYIKKQDVLGSYDGMRYRFHKGDDRLIVNIWPEPFCFQKTPEEKMITKEFELSVDGKEKAVAWMNEQHKLQSYK